MKAVLFHIFCLVGCLSAFAKEKVVETKPISINYLDEVTIKFPAKIVITQGDKNEYHLEGNSKSIKELKVSAQGGEALFEKKNLQIGPTQITNITVYISAKNLLRLNTEEVISIELRSIANEKLELDIKGKTTIEGDLNLQDLYVKLNGTISTSFKGSSKNQEIDCKGDITYDASNLSSTNVEITASGSGELKVNASQKLLVSTAGPVNVFYSGNPKKVKKNITGPGALKKL